MIKWIKRIWDSLDEQDKLLAIYFTLLSLLVLYATF